MKPCFSIMSSVIRMTCITVCMRYVKSVATEIAGTQSTRHHHTQRHYDSLQKQSSTILNQLKHICNMVSLEDYNKKLPSYFNASIGGHARHILDHFHQVLHTGFQHNLKRLNNASMLSATSSTTSS